MSFGVYHSNVGAYLNRSDIYMLKEFRSAVTSTADESSLIYFNFISVGAL